MNDKSDAAYDALFRSYENANKQIKELEAQLAEARAEVESYQAKLAEEQERNLNNVANADLQFAEMQAEITRLCALFRREGGCAREQGTSQWCAEAQRLADELNLANGELKGWRMRYAAQAAEGE